MHHLTVWQRLWTSLNDLTGPGITAANFHRRAIRTLCTVAENIDRPQDANRLQPTIKGKSKKVKGKRKEKPALYLKAVSADLLPFYFYLCLL
jgi:hypothetical protein